MKKTHWFGGLLLSSVGWVSTLPAQDAWRPVPHGPLPIAMASTDLQPVPSPPSGTYRTATSVEYSPSFPISLGGPRAQSPSMTQWPSNYDGSGLIPINYPPPGPPDEERFPVSVPVSAASPVTVARSAPARLAADDESDFAIDRLPVKQVSLGQPAIAAHARTMQPQPLNQAQGSMEPPRFGQRIVDRFRGFVGLGRPGEGGGGDPSQGH